MKDYINKVLNKQTDSLWEEVSYNENGNTIWSTTNLKESQKIPEMYIKYSLQHDTLRIEWDDGEVLFDGFCEREEEFDNILKYLRIDE